MQSQSDILLHLVILIWVCVIVHVYIADFANTMGKVIECALLTGYGIITGSTVASCKLGLGLEIT